MSKAANSPGSTGATGAIGTTSSLPPLPPPPKFDGVTARRFLSHIIDPEVGVTELRVFHAQFEGRGGSSWIVPNERWASTLAGWYNSVDDLLVDLGRLKGVSGYITINPVNPDLIARCANRIIKQKHTTTDADIAVFRWLYIDIDPRRPADISSTDEELAAAVETRDRILSEHSSLAPSSLWGKSGNGAWILVLLPDYLPDEGHDLAAQALAWLSATYSTKTVHIDVKTKNPSRVGVIPGTVKCKGSHVAGRPHRLATLDSPDREADDPLQPCDLKAWLASVGPPVATGTTAAPPSPPSNAVGGGGPAARPTTRDPDNRIRRATAYINGFAPAVSGQHGHDQAFDAACALIKGFDLSIEQARPILATWNVGCQPPWSDVELEHKLDSADKKRDDKPRGYLYEVERERPWSSVYTTPDPNGNVVGGAVVDDNTVVPEGMEEDAHRLARLVLDQHSHPDGPQFFFWREEYWAWTGTYYATIPKEEVRAEVTRVVHADFIRIYAAELMKFKNKRAANDDDDSDGPRPKKPKLRNVTTRLIGDVIQALKSLTILKIDRIFEQPAWIRQANDWNAVEVLPARNVLVHLPSLVAGQSCVIDPTPTFFNAYALSYDIGSLDKVGEPTEWLKFLAELWPDSPDSIATLQDWFGYLLTPDTSHQKIMMMIGPPRSGKGTIVRILTQLIGPSNVISPTLGDLTNHFGLEPLLGKPVAVITDARVSGRQDRALIVERLLSISGEDAQNVNRKHIRSITIKLPTRFMIVSNEIPNLKDSSGAFIDRMICLQLTRSFTGQEDLGLYGRLLKELPQILLWAIDGWKRLRERGRFVQPAASTVLRDELESTTSRIRAFVREMCVEDHKDPSLDVPVDTLYGVWKTWNQEQDREEFGNKNTFGSDLKAAFRFVDRKRLWTAGRGSTRIWKYVHIRLKTEFELAVFNGDTEEDEGSADTPNYLNGHSENGINGIHDYDNSQTGHTSWTRDEDASETPF